jgi:hypothetical protein
LFELTVFVLALLLAGGCFLILYLLKKKTNKVLSDSGAIDKIPNFGKYIIGLPNVNLQYAEITCGISDELLIFISNTGNYFGHIPINSISNIYIDRKTNINQRLTATRILALGIFSLAVPKNKKTEEYCIVIEWNDESEIIQNTIFEFSGDNCAQAANNAFSHLNEYIQPKKISNTPNTESSADELLKWSKLRDKGILTEEEFQAKKKEFLDKT